MQSLVQQAERELLYSCLRYDREGHHAHGGSTYQQIIQFRKDAEGLSEEEKARLEKRIAAYSNALAKDTK